MPKPSEVAQLDVGGVSFEDWETVWVQHRWMEAWPLFKFTAAERAPLPTAWADLQFKPGDPCTIRLGGQLAITGIITLRQTAYDANSHTVQLSGVGKQWLAATSSVDSKDGNFDKMPLKPIADKVLKPFDVPALAVGTLDSTPFDRLQSQPGELVFDFLDRIARVRGVTLGSDHLGNMLLIGEHTKPIVQQLIEGENILKMQCIISNEQHFQVYAMKGQKAVEDGTGPREAAEMEARVGGSLKYYKVLETVAEQPVKNLSELQMRTTYKAIQQEGTIITAHVTVQGWLRDGVDLWRTGDNVYVYSPMALLNMVMKIEMATFTQDNKGGTLTVLELVLPWKLGDKINALGEGAPFAQGSDPVADQFPPPGPAYSSDGGPPPNVPESPNPPEAPSPFDPGGALGPGPYP